MDNTIKRFPVDLDLDLQNDLRDAVYYSGQSKQSIAKVAMRTEVDRLLAKFKTPTEVKFTEKMGLTPKKIIRKKVN